MPRIHGGIMKEIDRLIEFYQAYMPKNVALVKDKERHVEVEQAIRDVAAFVYESDEQAKITVQPDDLTGSSIIVEIIADLVVIDMVDKFCDALRKADNFEVYAKTNGQVGLGLVFEKVFKPAPPKDEPFPEYYKDEE